MRTGLLLEESGLSLNVMRALYMRGRLDRLDICARGTRRRTRKEMIEYKVGDRVRIVADDSEKGSIGTISSASRGNWDWDVLLDGRGYDWGYMSSELELVKSAPVPASLSDVRIGDKVRWTIGDSEDRVISEFVVRVLNEYGAYGRESVAYAGRPWADEGQGVLEIIERGSDA